MAAEALMVSSRRLTASIFGVASPWLMTWVTPSRLVMYTRPAAPTGEA